MNYRSYFHLGKICMNFVLFVLTYIIGHISEERLVAPHTHTLYSHPTNSNEKNSQDKLLRHTWDLQQSTKLRVVLSLEKEQLRKWSLIHGCGTANAGY